MIQPKKIIAVVALGLIALTFVFYQFFYAYHLFFNEQIQLFVYTQEYLLSYFQKPACLSQLLGDFFTQFYYLRGGGALVLAIIFSVEWLLFRFLIKKYISSKSANWWAIVPVAVDFVLHLSLLHILASSMGLLLLFAIVALICIVKNEKIRVGLFLVFALTGHWLIGSAIYCLPFFLLFSNSSRKYVLGILSLVFIIVVPFVFRADYLLTFKQLFIYPAFSVKSLLLPLSVIATLFLSKIFLQMFKPHVERLTVSVATLAILIFGTIYNSNFSFERILFYDCEIYFGNTTKVLQKAEQETSKNKFIAYFTNIALAETGQLPEKLLDFYQPFAEGLILPVSYRESWQSIMFSNELFYLVGDMNMAQHSAMLANTFSPYCRSARMVKRLAEINMVNVDYPASMKYLRILQKTLFYHKWATKRINEIQENSETQWLVQRRKYIAQTDTIRNAHAYIESLEFLVQQNPKNKIALDFLLCFYLLNKDLKSFKQAYDCYLKPQNQPVAKIYAQALLIDFYREKVPQSILEEYRIPHNVITNFTSYTKQFQKTNKNIELLQKNFGKSYWFYYHFATMKESSKFKAQSSK